MLLIDDLHPAEGHLPAHLIQQHVSFLGSGGGLLCSLHSS